MLRWARKNHRQSLCQQFCSKNLCKLNKNIIIIIQKQTLLLSLWLSGRDEYESTNSIHIRFDVYFAYDSTRVASPQLEYISAQVVCAQMKKKRITTTAQQHQQQQ